MKILHNDGFKEHALFITPVTPTLTGRGPGFRAYQWVNYLHRSYKKVTIVCTSVYGEYDPEPEVLKNHPDIRICTIPLKKKLIFRFLNTLLFRPSTYNSVSEELVRRFENLDIDEPDIILGFKITSFPIVEWLKHRFNSAGTAIDIDEVNSLRVLNIGRLLMNNSKYWSAIKLIPEIVGYRVLESVVVKDLDAVIVSTQKEKRLFEEVSSVRPCKVFENKFLVKDPAIKENGQAFQFVFVGNSIHFPNRDAINIIINQIYPEIKRQTASDFRIFIIGGEPDKNHISAIKSSDEITYLNDTDDLESIYRTCDAALIPLRSGGGSSVKLLEALAHKKTVISSSVGVRGFNLEHGKHCLISDAPEVLASYCVRVINDRELASELAENGYRWYLKNQSYQPAF